jgi:hypothetical protein
MRNQTKAPAAPPLSPARIRLADLQRQRLDALAAVSTESANANRLDRVHAAIEPARAALAQFDAEHAAAMSRWAKHLVTGRPQAASARRAELAAELADAELSSAAAKVAQAGFQANAERAGQPIPRLDLEIRKAAKVVAIEEAAKLLPQIAEAIATAENLHSRLEAARAEAMSGIAWGSADFAEVHASVAAFDQARGVAEARPRITEPFATDWRRFTAALQQDAHIDFEGAKEMALPPTPFKPTSADPATAAMLAAASFPTQSIVR